VLVAAAIRFQQKVSQTNQGLRFTFQAADGTALKTVELHYSVNQQQVNVKMRSQTPQLWRHFDSTGLHPLPSSPST
jgi:hypothetical protein